MKVKVFQASIEAKIYNHPVCFLADIIYSENNFIKPLPFSFLLATSLQAQQAHQKGASEVEEEQTDSDGLTEEDLLQTEVHPEQCVSPLHDVLSSFSNRLSLPERSFLPELYNFYVCLVISFSLCSFSCGATLQEFPSEIKKILYFVLFYYEMYQTHFDKHTDHTYIEVLLCF